MTLIQQAFSIQQEITAILPTGFTPVDQGMMVPSGEETELWRDMTVENPQGDEFYISYSTSGNLKSEDVPEEILADITSILTKYQ